MDLTRFNPDVFSSKTEIPSKPIPGLHIVANFAVENVAKLRDSSLFRDHIHSLIKQYRLISIGEVFHEFEGGGFTGVICLTESHLSVHTWPENNYLTFDIFLSNYLKDNRQKTEDIYRAVATFFEAKILFENSIQR